MLTLSNARIRRGPQVLLDAATVTLFRGEKVGIVGRNGCGKSTLLALIRGEIATDAGEYRAPAGLTIASVAQDLPDSPRALIDYIQDGDEELRAVEAQLAAAKAVSRGTSPSFSCAAVSFSSSDPSGLLLRRLRVRHVLF